MPRNINCVVCNTEVDVLASGGFSFLLSFPRASRNEHYRPPGFVVHQACARQVAHPDFDFTVDLMGRDAEWREE